MRIPAKIDRKSVETILVGLVLLFCFLGLSRLVILSMETERESYDRQFAARMASDQIENLQGMAVLPVPPYIEHERGLAGKYERITSLVGHTIDTAVPPGLTRVGVIVYWFDRDNKRQSTTYSTLLESSHHSRH